MVWRVLAEREDVGIQSGEGAGDVGDPDVVEQQVGVDDRDRSGVVSRPGLPSAHGQRQARRETSPGDGAGRDRHAPVSGSCRGDRDREGGIVAHGINDRTTVATRPRNDRTHGSSAVAPIPTMTIQAARCLCRRGRPVADA